MVINLLVIKRHGLIVYGYGSNQNQAGFYFFNYVPNKTYNWCFAINQYLGGFSGSIANGTMNNCYAIGCSYVNNLAVGGFNLSTANVSLNNCEAHLNRTYGFNLGLNCDSRFNSLLAGTKGANIISDIQVGTNTYDTNFIFDDFNAVGTSTSPVFLSNMAAAVIGANIGFNNLYGTLMNNYFYQVFAYGNITGYGLADTKVRKTDGTWGAAGSGEYALSITPQNGTSSADFYYNIPSEVVTGVPITVSIWCKIASASYYAGVNTMPTMTITYDGTTTTSAVADTTAYSSANGFLLTKTFTPTTDYSTIKVTLTTASDASVANAIVYFDCLSFKERKYTKQFYAYQKDILSIDRNSTATSAPTPSTNPYITQTNPATVAAYGEFTINHSTQTCTVSSSTTLKRLYDYSQYDLAADGGLNSGVAEWLTTFDGVNFVSAYNIVLNTGVALTGGGSVNVGAMVFTLTGTATYDGIIITSTNRVVHVKLIGTVSGSSYYIAKSSDGTLLISGTASDGQTDDLYAYTADVPVVVKVRKSDYIPVSYNGTITSAGLSLNVSQAVDTIHA